MSLVTLALTETYGNARIFTLKPLPDRYFGAIAFPIGILIVTCPLDRISLFI